MYSAIQRAFHDPRSRAYAWVDRAVWTLILASLVLIVVDLKAPLSPAAHDLLR